MYHWDTLTKAQQDRLINEQVEHETSFIEEMLDGSWAINDETATRAVEDLMQPMVDGFQALIDHYLVGDKPRLPEWMEPVFYLGKHRVAYVFLSSLIRTFADPLFTLNAADGAPPQLENEISLQFFARLFGEDLWQMMSFFSARAKAAEFYKEQSKYFRNWDHRRRKAFAKKIDAIPRWTFKQKMNCAVALTRIAEQQNILGLHTIWRSDRKKKYDHVKVLRLTEDVASLFSLHATDLMARLAPTRMPMVCRPLDLTADDPGGWRCEDMRKRATYVTGVTADVVEIGEDGVTDLRRRATPERHSNASRETINNLQRTEWRVNERVLDVMLDFYRANNPVGKVPSSENEREKIGRLPEDADEDAIRAHKIRAAQAYTAWHRAETGRVMFSTLSRVASLMRGRVFWHAWFCDFRGRFYSDAAYLNPQGDDLNKALLKFAVPTKVSKKGIYWLMVALANEFGYDKENFDDRVRWVKERMDLWKAIDADPHGTVRDWEDGSPMKNATFLRLARVFDLMEALRTGYSSIPVNLDGSCNGVQHWAAMTRDANVAEKVNLVPTDKPQDLYQFVADGCTEICAEDPNPWRVQFLEYWDGAISRKVCKRSVMCDPYGISDYSVRTYVLKEGHLDWVPKENRVAATKEMGELICISKAKQMEFVNHGKALVTMLCGWAVDEMGSSFWWTSPNGFQVINFYSEQERVKLTLDVWNRNFEKKLQHKATFAVDSTDVSADASASAMPPNWVHSVDAAHMSMTVNGMVRAGITSLSSIHDSFGCPAEDVPVMRAIIKETFYAIHRHDLLDSLRQHAEAIVGRSLPCGHPIHEHNVRGQYDPRSILDSEYAFG